MKSRWTVISANVKLKIKIIKKYSQKTCKKMYFNIASTVMAGHWNTVAMVFSVFAACRVCKCKNYTTFTEDAKFLEDWTYKSCMLS